MALSYGAYTNTRFHDLHKTQGGLAAAISYDRSYVCRAYRPSNRVKTAPCFSLRAPMSAFAIGLKLHKKPSGGGKSPAERKLK